MAVGRADEAAAGQLNRLCKPEVGHHALVPWGMKCVLVKRPLENKGTRKRGRWGGEVGCRSLANAYSTHARKGGPQIHRPGDMLQ